jgi:hypothetical protein
MEKLAAIGRTGLRDGRFEEPSAILPAKPTPSASFRDVQGVLRFCILDIEELGFGNEVEVLAFSHLASFSNAAR